MTEQPEQVREKPIIFSGPMVRAILAGRKTQTRRVMKPQPTPYTNRGEFAGLVWGSKCRGGKEWLARYCPYGDSGDRLWVRETWGPCDGGIMYRASESGPAKPDDGRWHPAIHMHRSFSRIDLEIVAVRVERLQEISVSDAMAEGCRAVDIPPDEDGPWRIGYTFGDDDGKSLLSTTSIGAFLGGWDTINRERAPWASNPWVWVLEFRKVTQ